MYTIIGADGREYGPVSAEKVRDWIAAGRANAQTRIKAVDAAEWTFIGALPEFAGAAAPAAVAPAAAQPGVAPVDAGELIARTPPLDIGSCLGRGWGTARANFFPLLGVALLIGICLFAAGIIPFATLFFTGVFYGGLYFYALKKARGTPAEIGDAFSGFGPSFGPLALASLVSTLLITIGFIFLIIPGIYLAVAWMFSFLVIREKGLPFWDGMELSRRVVSAQWFRVFGLFLLLTVIVWAVAAIPGVLLVMGIVAMNSSEAAGVGLLLTGLFGMMLVALAATPVYLATMAHAYDHLFNPPPRGP
ncbi:MAG TPA: hypothetical protein VEB66_04025 [Opitutaceae bacterium]|nr:hypothetical protein [Opitutaceae bacterium]